MRLLLDTHTFLWFIDDNPRLSSNAKSLLESDNDFLLSTASLSALGYEHDYSEPVIRLWDDTRHVGL